jgi:adenine-specific DNA-methyltransferase
MSTTTPVRLHRGRIVFPKSRDEIVQMKDYLKDFRRTLCSVIDFDARAGSNRLKTLFGEAFDGFRYAKPVELIERTQGNSGTGAGPNRRVYLPN